MKFTNVVRNRADTIIFPANGTDSSTRKVYMSRIICLRLLAKFLGYITSLPYKSDCNHFSDHMLDTQIKIRQQVFYFIMSKQ